MPSCFKIVLVRAMLCVLHAQIVLLYLICFRFENGFKFPDVVFFFG